MVIRAIDTVNEVVGRLVVGLAAIFAVVIIYDVVMRYAFNAPTRFEGGSDRWSSGRSTR